MVDTDVIVIGAGAVGLACAAEFARKGQEVIVLESASMIGTGTSSRNSEVIHAGIYYPTDSIRHRMCISGRRQLYERLRKHNIAHKQVGKLIVATSDAQTGKMEAIHAQGTRNEVEGLTLISGKEAMAMEPHLQCKSAILSETTGILDSHAYMLSLHGEIEDHGGVIAFNAPVIRTEILSDCTFRLHVGGDDPTQITCRKLINSAGLYAHRIAQNIDGYDKDLLPYFTLAKGSYFTCQTKPVFSKLIYPAPEDGGLGVHVTLDLGGQMKFGPDVEWLNESNPDKIDYRVDIRRADNFYAAIRQYWPGLPDGCIAPDYSGVRPKLSNRGQPAIDFRIDGPTHHGQRGLIHLFGIESPGLTSSLAIAQNVWSQIAD